MFASNDESKDIATQQPRQTSLLEKIIQHKETYVNLYLNINQPFILNKSLFHYPLFWSSQDGAEISPINLITVYMTRPNQRDTDTLCKLFNPNDIKNIINENIDNLSTINEAKRQVDYYISKSTNTPFNYLNETDQGYLSHKSQRVFDYYCNLKGVETIQNEISNSNLPTPTKSILKDYLRYYIQEKNIIDEVLKI